MLLLDSHWLVYQNSCGLLSLKLVSTDLFHGEKIKWKIMWKSQLIKGKQNLGEIAYVCKQKQYFEREVIQ